LPGAIVPLLLMRDGINDQLEWLLEEVSVSINTAAAGGDLSLMRNAAAPSRDVRALLESR
jgi:delta 1-pyrroline-5-carboxylate dehydrogenase